MTRNVKVVISAEIGDLKAKLREGGTAVRSFSGEMDKAAKAGHLGKIGDQAGAMGLGLLAGFGYAVKAAADFDKQMSAVGAGVEDAAGHMDELRAAAIKAGKDTQYSATAAAQGITELGKAGVKSADILGGGLKGALSLAAAGQLDVGEAAETAASAMTQFKLSGDKIPHVADLLAAGAGKAQGSVHDLSAALNQSGLIAASTGLTIEDTTGTLAAFASAGLMGSDAGTSFKTMLQALQAPSSKTQGLMDELGISAYDANGQFVGIANLAGILRDKLAKLTPEMRSNAMAQIFGSDATRAANVLYEQGQAGIQGWINKTNDAGYAADTAAKLTDNLAGDLERLKGSLETMAIEGGSGANSGLRVLTKSLGAVVDEFGQLNPAVSGTLVTLAGVGGAVLLGLAGWIKMREGIAKAVAELNASGPAGEKAATGLQKASKAAAIAGAAFVALEVAGAVFDKLGNDAVNVDKLTAALSDYATTGKMTQGITDDFGQNLDELGRVAQFADGATHGFGGALNGLAGVIPGVSSMTDSLSESLYGTSFGDATDKMKGLDQALSAFMATQKDATRSSEIWNQILDKSGLSTDQLAKLLPNAWTGLQKLQSTAHGAAGATGEAAKSTDDMGKAAAKAKAEIKSLNESFKNLFDGQMSADRAQINFQEGLITLRAELTKGTRTLSLHSEEGRKNRSAVLDQLSVINDLREARFNEGQELDSVNKKYKTDVEGLRASMLAAGFKKDAVDKLIGSYRAIPGKVGTEIETPGLPQSSKAIKGYKGQLDALTRQIKTHVSVEGDKAAYAKLEKLLVAQQAAKKGISVSAAQSAFNKNAYRTGGWTGPGGEHDEAGVVHADEYVIKKSSRRKIEARNPGMLDEMNATGQVPGYAGGGMVMPFPVNAAGTKVPTMAQAMSVVGGVGAGAFGKWPSSPGAQRGDSGVWRKIVALVKASGIPFDFGNGYRPGDPLWHGSGRAVDFMGFNQDRLAQFFMARKSSVLELIHRSKGGDYGLTRGHYNAMPHQWPLHKNHLHVAMANGGVIGEHVLGVGRSGRTYEFGERGPERVTPMRGYAGGGLVNVAPQDTTRTITTPGRFTPTGTRLDTIEAMLAAADAVARLSSALKENGRSFSQNTQKGRDNRQALISGIRAAQDAARAKYAETGSIKAANKVYADYIKALDASLKKMGVNATTRRALLKAYSEKPKYDVPEPTSSTITTPGRPASNSAGRVGMVSDQIGVEQALTSAKSAFAWSKPSFNVKTATGQAELQQLFSFLSAAQAAAQSAFDYNGDAKGATTYYNGYIAQLKAVLKRSGLSDARINELMKAYARITLTPKANRWGGLYDHAANGMLTDAKAASAGSTLYGWREPSTGGELFAPKNGNLAKTRAEVGWAVSNWWGGKVNWQPGQSGGAAGPTKLTINAPIQIDLGGEVIHRVVRLEVDTAIGQVANAAVYQTA